MTALYRHKNISMLLSEKRAVRNMLVISLEKLTSDITFLEHEEMEEYLAEHEASCTQVGYDYDEEECSVRNRKTKKRKFENTNEYKKVFDIGLKSRGKEKRAKAPTTRAIAKRLKTKDLMEETIARQLDEHEYGYEHEHEIDDRHQQEDFWYWFEVYSDVRIQMGWEERQEKQELEQREREKQELEKQEREKITNDLLVRNIEEYLHLEMLDGSPRESDIHYDMGVKTPNRMTKTPVPKKISRLRRCMKIDKELRSKRKRKRSRTHMHGERDWD